VAVQEDHDFPDRLLVCPGRKNAGSADRSNAGHLAQSIRCCFDNVEHLFAEGPHQLFGIDRTNAADHAGGEIFLDPFRRSRGRGTQEPRFELLAVGAVVDPLAGGRDPLASRNGRGMANHGDDVTMSARPREERKNRFRRCGRLLGRQGPPTLPE
jgi:hypothetical protein